MIENCKSCKFWVESFIQSRKGFGECRRYPIPYDTVAGYGCGEFKPNAEKLLNENGHKNGSIDG